eukprot:m51a1_g9394 hypothetical protein (568) ;mRNA; r:264565-266482
MRNALLFVAVAICVLLVVPAAGGAEVASSPHGLDGPSSRSGAEDQLAAIDSASGSTPADEVANTSAGGTYLVGSQLPRIQSTDCRRAANQKANNAPYSSSGIVVGVSALLKFATFTPAGQTLSRVSGTTTVVLSQGTAASSVALSQDFFVVFNPWLSTDPVYCQDSSERAASLLKTSGTVYLGNAGSGQGMVWNYGQFDAVVLQVLQWFLSGLGSAALSDPVLVSRSLQISVSNSLWGAWDSSQFVGSGVDPRAWSSTPDIMATFVNNGYNPVKWAQCWVYAATLTTTLRAVGIVTRQVMCAPCPHNQDGSYYTRLFYTSAGLRGGTADMWWNFHNWNECWMRRADWSGVHRVGQFQAIDSTYAVGPGPRTAVRGQVDGQYDVSFFRSETWSRLVNIWNGVQMYQISKDDQLELPHVYTPDISNPGSSVDITGDYRPSSEPAAPAGPPSDLPLSVSRVSIDAGSSPGLFSYTLQSSKSVKVSVLTVVAAGGGCVSCGEALLYSKSYTASVGPSSPFSTTHSFAWDSASWGGNVIWFRLFVTNTATGSVVFWNRYALPSSSPTLLFAY